MRTTGLVVVLNFEQSLNKVLCTRTVRKLPESLHLCLKEMPTGAGPAFGGVAELGVCWNCILGTDVTHSFLMAHFFHSDYFLIRNTMTGYKF